MRWLKILLRRLRPTSRADAEAECERIVSVLPMTQPRSDFAELIFVGDWTHVTADNAQDFGQVVGQPVVDAIMAAKRKETDT